MKKVLILSFSTIASDPRVMRQVRLLENTCDLTVAGYGEAPPGTFQFVRIEKPLTPPWRKVLWAAILLARAFETYHWSLPQVQSAQRQLKGKPFDLVLANDLAALPLALRLSGTAPVLFDAHEYSPREYEDQFVWRLLFQRHNHTRCRQYLPRAASMLTVCQGIADEYATHYGVPPIVIHNAPAHQPLQPSPLEPDRVRMIHHGVASRARHLESMIDMMALLDHRFSLDLMLMEVEPGYLEALRDRAANDARIRFLTPVPMQDICRTINRYDVGVYLLRPDNFNHRHALPNKFFEFVQARLAIAIGPSPEMQALVERHRCGVVAPTFQIEDLARSLQQLTHDDLRRMKSASHTAAAELSFEHDGARLAAEVQRLLNLAQTPGVSCVSPT